MDNIEEIQKEVKDHFGIEISEDEIEAIITSQSRATKFGVESGEDIQWIYFGKFKIKLGRKGFLSRNKEIQKDIIKKSVNKVKGIKKINFSIKLEMESIIKINE